MGKLMRAIGLMSGTSMDGIDVALIDTDGENEVLRGPSATYPYSQAFREKLALGLADAASIQRRGERPGRLKILEQYLTDLHVEAVMQFREDNGLGDGQVDVIGFHGQTVLHRAARTMVHTTPKGVPWTSVSPTLTVQIGDGQSLANATGIDVIYDMRAADAAAGGQGAPLVPVFHRALATKLEQKPIAIVNIGGVANVTWIGGKGSGGDDGQMLAFDTGPGNAMIDDWMLRHTGAPRDPDGMQAAQGHVHEDIVTEYLRHSHFAARPPKSLDRNAFELSLVEKLSVADGAATLTAFSAAGIARAREHFSEQPQLWLVAGGGRRNKTLMSMLAGRVENAVAPAESVGLDGDTLEAEAWAYLAVRSLKGLPLTYPTTTGAAGPVTGGVLAKAVRPGA